MVVLVVPMVMVAVVLVNHRVALATGDEIAVDREGRHERYHQRYGQASPEQEGERTSVHGARYDEHYQVVHDFHDGDRERVSRESDG